MVDVIKQEVSQSGSFFHQGHDQEFQVSGAPWSHMVPVSSSPRSSVVASFSSNNLLDFTYNKEDHRKNQLPPDHTSEVTNTHHHLLLLLLLLLIIIIIIIIIPFLYILFLSTLSPNFHYTNSNMHRLYIHINLFFMVFLLFSSSSVIIIPQQLLEFTRRLRVNHLQANHLSRWSLTTKRNRFYWEVVWFMCCLFMLSLWYIFFVHEIWKRKKKHMNSWTNSIS